MLSGDLRKVSGENIEIRTIPVENANIIKNVHPQSTQVIRVVVVALQASYTEFER